MAGRGWGYQKARQGFLRSQANNPLISSADRGWLRNEIRSIDNGSRRYIRSPPGKDVGHKVAKIQGGADDKKNFHLEFSRDNRARGPRERRVARKGLRNTIKWLRLTRCARLKRILHQNTTRNASRSGATPEIIKKVHQKKQERLRYPNGKKLPKIR